MIPYRFYKSRNDEPIINNTGLIIDTSGCRIPKLDPWDPSVAHLVKLQKPYICKGHPLFLSTAQNGSIILNLTSLASSHLKASDLSCFYQGIRRLHEKKGSKREVNYKFTTLKLLPFGQDLKEDHVRVECVIKGVKVFQHFFPLARLKESVENVKSWMVSSPMPKLNVILVAIDSVSKLNFLRHFQKTHTFLFKNLSPFDMKGYTKVGENTFPNLIPMLTGNFYDIHWNESVRNTKFWDDVDLVWKSYASKGYRTFYAEDMPLFGTFQYEKRGFRDAPTDYYFRPLALAMHYSKVKKNSQNFCLNSQFEIEMIYNYLKDFVRVMDTRPFFAFAMVSTVTHDVLNYAGYMDDPTVQLLEDLLRYGTLNKTALIFFSDHGLRFGPIRKTYIGKFEERMPFMYIHFPEWFLKQHPQLTENLFQNQKRLITLFDVHETLLDVLSTQTEKPEIKNASSRLGLSLLQKIPENRTCSEANIIPHYCPCQTYKAVSSTQKTVIKSAQEIVNNINTQLQNHKEICASLSLRNISDAQITHANKQMLEIRKQKRSTKTVVDRVKAIDRYLITLTTDPGGAMFEGTVQHDSDNDFYKVLGISRINMYGNQSECIDIHRLKIFCYCIS